MKEAMLFLLGFTAITSVYEIAKTSKSTKSNSLKRNSEKFLKNLA